MWTGLNTGDRASFLACFGEAGVLRSALDGAEYHGREELTRWWDELAMTVDRYEGEIEQFLELDGVGLALVRVTARGAASGMEATAVVGQVFTVAGNSIASLSAHRDPAGAFEEAGRQLKQGR